jgi:hypothetical protein
LDPLLAIERRIAKFVKIIEATLKQPWCERSEPPLS